MFAIGADGEVQRRAALGGVVKDENDAAVGESNGVEAGIGVGEIEGVNGGPVKAGVGGIGDADFGDLFGGTGVHAKRAVFEANDGRLDDAISAGGCGIGRCGDGADASPGESVVSAAFDPGGPGMITFDRGSTDDGAVGEDEGFGADRTVEACWQVFDGRPGSAVVGAEAAASGPTGRMRTEFVIEPEFAVG